MSSPRGGSPPQPWTPSGGPLPGSHGSRQEQDAKQSPAKAMAGALKRLFRLSTGEKVPADLQPPSPVPSPQAGTSPTRPRRAMEHGKPASFKHQGSMEPPSVLDYDDRFSLATDRTSQMTAGERGSMLTDRISNMTAVDRGSMFTDRSSAIPGDRSSALTDRTSTVTDRASGLSQGERPSNFSRNSSRGSGSSRLGTYIRSLIKQPSTVGQPSAGDSPSGTAPTSPVQRPLQPQTVQGGQGNSQPTSPTSPSGSAAPRHAAFILGSNTSGANSPTAGAYRSPRANSPIGPAPVQSSPPRSLPEQATLLPPSASAIARMQRDPNLLTVCNDLPPSMDRVSWRFEDYTLLQKLHAGYASAVYKAFCRTSGQTVALKVYQPAKLHEISQFQLYREARLHTQMSHPNIVKLYAAFRNGDTVILVQEYADGGDLLQLLMQHGTRLSERRATQLVLQPLLRALYYLHSRLIVHRDVKLENILFMGREMTLKLADFGLCLNLREERSVTRAGTLDYMAPEVLRCPQKHKPQDNKDRLDLAYTMTVDIWAMGVVAYELLNGCPPFTCHDKKETEKRIQSGLMPEFVVDVSDSARDFVYCCLAGNADQRPTAWQLLRYQWIKAGTRTSTSVLMDAMAARRAAGPSSPPPMAPLADVHLGDTSDYDTTQNAPARAIVAVPGSSSSQPSPSAAHAQQLQQLAMASNSPTAFAQQTTALVRTVATGNPRHPVDPSMTVIVPPSVNTGRLYPGNIVSGGGSGPLLAVSKSGQPLLSTAQLLQQQQQPTSPHSPHALSPLSSTLSASLGRSTASNTSTRAAVAAATAGNLANLAINVPSRAWAGSPDPHTHDQAAFGPPSGLSPITTRPSQQLSTSKSVSMARTPGTPVSPGSSSSHAQPHLVGVNEGTSGVTAVTLQPTTGPLNSTQAGRADVQRSTSWQQSSRHSGQAAEGRRTAEAIRGAFRTLGLSRRPTVAALAVSGGLTGTGLGSGNGGGNSVRDSGTRVVTLQEALTSGDASQLLLGLLRDRDKRSAGGRQQRRVGDMRGAGGGAGSRSSHQAGDTASESRTSSSTTQTNSGNHARFSSSELPGRMPLDTFLDASAAGDAGMALPGQVQR